MMRKRMVLFAVPTVFIIIVVASAARAQSIADETLAEADARLAKAIEIQTQVDAKLASIEERQEKADRRMVEANKKIHEADRKLAEAQKLEGATEMLAKAESLELKAQQAAREAQAAKDALSAEQKNSEFKLALIAVASETEEPIARLLQEAKFCLRNHCPDELVEAHLNVLDEVDREAYAQCEYLGQELEVDHDSIRSICLKFHMSMFGTPSDEIYFALVEKYFP